MSQKVFIYTDGSSIGNPGPGGYGAVLLAGSHRKELSEGFFLTTNNRMELLAVIKAIQAMKKEGLHLIIHSDSKYVIDAVTKGWVNTWFHNGFKKKKNKDLWLKYLEVAKKHHIEFRWVKGHAGNKENERCDYLAKMSAESPSFHDNYYEEVESKNQENDTIFNSIN